MVICPSLSNTVPIIQLSTFTGLDTVPPKSPLCRSWSGPVTRISNFTRPRRPVVMLGTSALTMSVSLTRMMSAFSFALFSGALSHSFRAGEPISSSPSRRNFTLQGSVPRAIMVSNALACIKLCPLSSSAPRAHILPSLTTGSKGSVCHNSNGVTGITS